ncbi:MAG: 50S ribosomal protein L4 [Chlamydiota bacterium]
MSLLKKYDLTGKELGEHEIDDSLLSTEASLQLIKNYIVAIRKNARQWSANTKTRSEVCRTKKKPHAQKGTGRARQGTLSAPQYKGGGVAFGPKPKFDQHVRINKKERQAAIRHLLAEKIKNQNVKILEIPAMRVPKTNKVATFLEKANIMNKSVLFLGEIPEQTAKAPKSKKNDVFVKSMRNIPRKDFSSLGHINGYDLASNQEIVVLSSALEQFTSIVTGESKS